MKFLFKKNIIKETDTELCSMCNIEKHFNNFTKNIQNVKLVLVQENWNVTMTTKTNFRSNKKYNMRKMEMKNDYRNKTIDVYNLKT